MQADTIQHQVIQSLREGAKLRLQMIEESVDLIMQAITLIRECLESGGKVLLFGNGGSAADAQHIAAEFVGRFTTERQPLSAIALTTDSSIITSIGNDYGFEEVFARQIRAIGRPEDLVIAITTSGNSPNVLAGVKAARDQGLSCIGLTGGNGGQLSSIVDVPIAIPTKSVARVQECHITIGHIFCELIEAWLLDKPSIQMGHCVIKE